MFIWLRLARQYTYILSCRSGENSQIFRLDIDLPTVTRWYSNLINTQDDLSDAESAEEILAELNALVGNG